MWIHLRTHQAVDATRRKRTTQHTGKGHTNAGTEIHSGLVPPIAAASPVDASWRSEPIDSHSGEVGAGTRLRTEASSVRGYSASALGSGGAGDAAASGVPRLLANGLPIDWFSNRARYIPLRLTVEERKFPRRREDTLM